MERYVWINPDRLNDAQRRAGIDFIVELSPYDVPHGVTGVYAEEKGEFAIIFEYIDDEPSEIIDTDHGIKVLQGKHSGKLQKVLIPIDKPPLDAAGVIRLESNVLNAVRHMKKWKSIGSKMNRRFTRRVLKDSISELAGAIE